MVIRTCVYNSLLSIISVTFVCGLALTCTSAYADESVVDEVVINVPSSCTFGVGGGGTYSIELDNGEDDVVTANNITVSCNDISGYAIYAIGFSGDSYYGTNTDLIHESDTSYNIKTDGTGTYGSSWKMKLTAVSNATIEGNYATAWQNIPSTYVKVASFTTNTTESVITPQYQITISNNQMAGTYTGKVKYTLVHPNTAPAPLAPLDPSKLNITNAIIYAPNTSDTEGDMSSLPQTSNLTNAPSQAGAISATPNSTTTLIAPNFKRAGYGFAGWSTSFDATTATNPVIYGPNETISTNPTNGGLNVSGGAVLYPVWVESKGNLQGWTGCSSLTPASYDSTTGALTATLSSITALTDTRDNNVYTVARLADGQCWMVENLRLDSAHSSDSTKAQGYGDDTTNNRGRFIGLANSEDANFNNTNPPVANTLYSTDGTNNTININTTNYPYARIPRYNNNNTNMTTNATNSDGTTTLGNSYNTNNNHVRWYGYGNYYNWPAAMASTKYYTSYYNANNNEQQNSDAAGTSLCPTGWRLPLGVASTGTLTGTVADDALDSANRVGSFSYLNRRMGGTGASNSTNSVTSTTMSTYWRKFPNNFVYSGYWDGARAGDRSSSGYYWSSSASGNGRAYVLYLYSSYVYPGTGSYDKYLGSSVRCVAGS